MHLTRRFFLKSTGALAAYVGVAPTAAIAGFDPAAAEPVARGRTLVVIFLRGGADGLNIVVPHADPHYPRLRPGLHIPAPGAGDAAGRAIDLDGFFGLHPALRALRPMFGDGSAVAAHAVGYDRNTRSHFEEQDVWETGVIGNTVNSDGWLNRHLATSTGHGPIRAVALGDSLPRILHGKAPAFAVRGIDSLRLAATPGVAPDAVSAALEHAYCTDPARHRADAGGLLADTAATTLDGLDQLGSVFRGPYRPEANYPRSGLASQLRQVAQLIKAGVGLEVAQVDVDGWDTHANQGGATGGFANRLRELGDAIAAFSKDLGDRLDDTLIVTMTDFGRTAAENGTRGTDHGWANCMLLAGGPVLAANRAAPSPRMVVADWPGLAPDQLHERRDLRHTTDFRDVLAEIVRVHLGNPRLETVLPSHTFKPVGLIA